MTKSKCVKKIIANAAGNLSTLARLFVDIRYKNDAMLS